MSFCSSSFSSWLLPARWQSSDRFQCKEPARFLLFPRHYGPEYRKNCVYEMFAYSFKRVWRKRDFFYYEHRILNLICCCPPSFWQWTPQRSFRTLRKFKIVLIYFCQSTPGFYLKTISMDLTCFQRTPSAHICFATIERSVFSYLTMGCLFMFWLSPPPRLQNSRLYFAILFNEFFY